VAQQHTNCLLLDSIALEDVSKKVLDHGGNAVRSPCRVTHGTASVAEGTRCYVAGDGLEGKSKAKVLGTCGGACEVLLVRGRRRPLCGVDEGDNAAELALLAGGTETARGFLNERRGRGRGGDERMVEQVTVKARASSKGIENDRDDSDDRDNVMIMMWPRQKRRENQMNIEKPARKARQGRGRTSSTEQGDRWKGAAVASSPPFPYENTSP